jgi:hypothetical protein
MIKYLGIYQSVRPVELGKVLYAYEQEHEIIINYDESEPFRIHHLSIEVDCVIRNRIRFTSYQVFEVEMFAQTKEEAILLAQEFSKNILKLREDLFDVFQSHQQS